MSLKIGVIGAGNLATQLSFALQSAGYEIAQVFSRTERSAQTLGEKLQTKYTNQTSSLTNDADMYIVALSDSALSEVLPNIDFKNRLVVHCSGSLPLTVLRPFSKNTGVLYPLQTFSKSRNISFKNIPVFVESENLANRELLLQMASSISEKVQILDSEKRKSLHISAVLACNFVNHMYTLAAAYLQQNYIEFDVLHPLIRETAQKAIDMPPYRAQTGPAVRFDENIINDHLERLNDFPGLQELYNSISKSIFEFHQKKR